MITESALHLTFDGLKHLRQEGGAAAASVGHDHEVGVGRLQGLLANER